MADTKKMPTEASTSTGATGGGGGGGETVLINVGRRKSTCGYCKSGSRTSITYGLWANSLTVDHYQALLDRGWRRSGCYLYKPEMEKTCCPSYTIRLKATDFSPSKEQVRVSKKMQRFLDGTLDAGISNKFVDEPSTFERPHSDAHNFSARSSVMESSKVDSQGREEIDRCMHSLSKQIDELVQLCLKSGELPSDIQLPKGSVKKVAPAKIKLQAGVSENLIYSSNIAFQIAATLRPTKKVEHGGGVNIDLVELSPKKIAELLANHSKQTSEPCNFSIRACNGHINFFSAIEQEKVVEESAISKKMSPVANGSDNKSLKKNGESILGKRRRFEIRLKKSSFDYEEYSLYRKYQLQVHNDTNEHVSESSYKRFLVDSPLIHISPTENVTAPPCGFGSFHQQYLVDGKLIAVGVIDILPKCLSSKYLFWDPDLAFLSLGKYSALEEIRWVSKIQSHCSSLQYYYLGYYIHSCNKMKYKAAYQPSELLCPLRYQWVPYDAAKPLLDRRKYVILSDLTSLQNGDSVPLDSIDNIMEEQQNKDILEAPNDVFVNDERAELEDEDSDDESDLEASDETSTEPGHVDIDNVLIGVKEARFRYKDISHAFVSSQKISFENQLQRYTTVVGTELAEEIVFSIG